MIDIESYFLSLKASWLYQMIHTEKRWAYISKYYLTKLAPLEVILQMSFRDKHQMKCINQLFEFYQEIILGYCKSKDPQFIVDKNILYNLPLWGNRLLLANKCCLYSQNMIDSNILYVRDVLKLDSEFKTNIWESLCKKTSYYSDLTLIRKALFPFKDKYINNHSSIEFQNVHTLAFPPKSRYYYTQLKDQKELPPICIGYWKNKLISFDIH